MNTTRKKQWLSFWLALCLCVGVLPAAAGGGGMIVLPAQKLDGYMKYTPESNKFRLASQPSREFVILDSDETGFLIISNEIYAAREFDSDGTQRFNTEDVNNIAYWLNHDFLQDDAMLPPELKPYIDQNRIWETEPGHQDGNCPEPYEVTCGISLLSYTEFMKYYKMFGLQYDGLKTDWYLRSPLASAEGLDVGICAGGTYANEGKLTSSSTTIVQGVRPVFWIQKEFFKDVRLSIPELGSKAAEIIRKTYRVEAMREGGADYSDYELKRMGYSVPGVRTEYIDIDIPNAPTYIQNQKEAYVEVGISISGNENIAYTAECSPKGDWTDTIAHTGEAKPYEKLKLRFDLSAVPKGKYSTFSVRIVNDDGVLARDVKPVTIMEIYQPQPLDEYSRVGVNWQIIQKTTHGQFVEYYNQVMNYSGITKTRCNYRWEWIEQNKGARPFGKHDFWNNMMKKYNQTFAPYILGTGNPLYYPEEPRTYQNVMDTIDYNIEVLEYLKNYGVGVTDLEIWNEPNLLKPWKSNRWITYSQLANRMAFEIEKRFPEMNIMGCAIASSQGEEYIDAFFRRGGLMYVDEFSCHPYTYPNSTDIRHYNRARQFVSRRDEAGGWVEVSETEVGFPTHTAQGGVTDDKQAIYIPKLFFYNDELDVNLTNLYVFEDLGWDDTYREHNFGILDMNYVPKEAVITLEQVSKYCGNAQYIGRYPINDTDWSYVYAKPGGAFEIVWSTQNDKTFEYSLEPGETAEDMYGNPIEAHNGYISVGEKFVYVCGISAEKVAKAVEAQAANEISPMLETYKDKIDVAGLQALKEAFGAEQMTTASGIKKAIEQSEAFSLELIDRWTQNTTQMELKELTLLLFNLHRVSKRAANAFSLFDIGAESGEKEYESAVAFIRDRKGSEPDSSLLYADAIMRYAQRYREKQKKVSDPSYGNFSGKTGVAAANGIMAKYTARLAEKLAAYEKVDTSRAVFTYLEDTDPTVYQGQNFSYFIEIENLRNRDLKGTVLWKDADGNPLGEEIPCEISSGQCGKVSFNGYIPESYPLGEQFFYVDIMEDGKLLKRCEMQVTVKGIAAVKLQPSAKSLSALSEITIDLTSTYNQNLTGTLEVQPPEGWQLAKDSVQFVMAPGENRELKFKVSNTKQVPYNEYCFGITVKDEQGKVLTQTELPLNFLVATRAEAEMDISQFDGEISGWEDAYPIYVNAPENPSQLDSWRNANRAIKSLMKWDDDYFYVLTDVYDDMYTQSYVGSNLWQGDSIQLAFDTLNDKAEKFVEDDYEYGFSYTAAGLEIQAYYAAAGKATGAKRAEWAKIIRDAENHVTRYVVKLPKDELTPMRLSKGTKFGFNLCANDADVVEREAYIQFTSGIADGKKTATFMTFELIGSEKGVQDDGAAEQAFIKKINNSGFDDKDK